MGTIATIRGEGQVTVPPEIRERLGLHEGDQVEFVLEQGRAVMLPSRGGGDVFERWRGSAQGSFKSVDEVNAWVRDLRGSDEEDL